MRTRVTTPAFTALAALAAAFATLTLAGPLDPPAGPVAPTYKTLAEVEPRIAVNATNTPGDADSLYRIAQPGSYYLTGNITGETAQYGIEIAASGVTLDLMGHQLVGVAGALDGIAVTAGGVDIAVLNGSIRAWPIIGLDANGTQNTRFENLRISGSGSYGLLAGDTASITGCTARSNAGPGIGAGAGSTVTNCTARSNGTGFNLGTEAAISNCTAQQSSGTGFNIGFGSTISRCTARFSGSNGFAISSGSIIEGCTAQSSTADGIRATGESVIRGNVCDSNGANAGDGAGIHATFGDNRIEGNSCTRNDRGIDIDVAGNIVVRNTCSGNTINWVIVVGNAVAPIAQAATNAAAISGNAYAPGLGSTDPNANFTY